MKILELFTEYTEISVSLEKSKKRVAFFACFG